MRVVAVVKTSHQLMGFSLWGKGGALGLVVDADDLPAPLLPPAVQELRLALLLHGHGRPVQHWRNTTARQRDSVSEERSKQEVSGGRPELVAPGSALRGDTPL